MAMRRRGGGAPGKKGPARPAGQLPSESLKGFLTSVADFLTVIEDDASEEFRTAANSRLTNQKKNETFELLQDPVAQSMIYLRMDPETSKAPETIASITGIFNHGLEHLKELFEAMGEDESSSTSEVAAEEQAAIILEFLSIPEALPSLIGDSDEAIDATYEAYCDCVSEIAAVGNNTNKSEAIRQVAMDTLSRYTGPFAKKLQAGGAETISKILTACFDLCAADDEGFDKESFSSQNLGTSTLDTVAFSLCQDDESRASFSEKVLALTQEKLKSGDRMQQKAALICLAVLPLPCRKFIAQKERLSNIMSMIISSMSDADDLVRAASFICAAEFVEVLYPEVKSYYTEMLSKITAALQNNDEMLVVKSNAALTLIQISRKCAEKDVAQLLTILPTAIEMIKATRAKSFMIKDDCELVAMLITFIRRVAVLGKSQIDSHATYIITMMKECMNDKDEMFKNIRTAAIAGIGDILASVSSDVAATYLKDCTDEIIKIASESSNDYVIMSACHLSFGQLATVLKDSLPSYLDRYFTFLLSAPAPAEFKAKRGGDDEDEEDDEEGDDDEEEEEEEDEEEDMMDEDDEEQAEMANDMYDSAFICLTSLAKTLGRSFAPHIMDVLNFIKQKLIQDAEIETFESVCEFYSAIPSVLPIDKTLTPGVSVELPEDVKTILLEVTSQLKEMLSLSTQSVQCSMTAFSALLKAYGKAILDMHDLKEVLLKQLVYIFESQGTGSFHGMDEEDDQPQIEVVDEENEDNEDNEDDEHGPQFDIDDEDEREEIAEFMTSSMNLYVDIGKSLGAAFEPSLNLHFDKLMKCAENDFTDGFCIGSIAEFSSILGVTTEGEPLFAPYVERVYQQAVKALKNRSAETPMLLLSNAASAIGILCLKGGQGIQTHFTEIYDLLKALIEEFHTWASTQTSLEDEDYHALDEYGAALAKLMLTNDKIVPINECVKLFIQCLPLRDDMEEANFVYSLCVKMITTYPTTYPGTIEPHLSTLLNIFMNVLSTINDAKLSGFIIRGAKAIQSNHVDVYNQTTQSWTSEQRDAFTKKLDA